MNNRFLFRAKHVLVLHENEHLNGRWIEGHLSDENYIYSPSLGEEFLIDPSTICQHVPSGECSLNEKQIWENDIVTDGKYIGVVKFGEYWDKHIGFYIEWKEPNDMLRQDICYWLPKIKAIGNIFDNPELLEVE